MRAPLTSEKSSFAQAAPMRGIGNTYDHSGRVERVAQSHPLWVWSYP